MRALASYVGWNYSQRRASSAACGLRALTPDRFDEYDCSGDDIAVVDLRNGIGSGRRQVSCQEAIG